MQKKFLLLVLIIATFTGTTVFSQSLHFGIKGGTDIHKISGKSFKDQFAFGYQIGGFIELGLTSRFGIQPEILFSQVNVDTSNSFSSVYQFNKISGVKLNYLNIPILLNYKPNKFVAFQVGPQFGILVSQTNNLLQNGKDAFKKGDFSMLGGLQVEISKLRLYGRYAIGLSNINDIDNKEKWKNQSIQLGIGITL